MASDLGETATSGAMPAASPARADGFRPGDQLGRYVIERVLGAGGMGLVYAAHDPDLDRRVAIKVLRGDASEESRARLLREARAMAKVSHPSVITVYEVGTAASVDFVAMELLEGGSLADWLRAERRDPAEVLRRFRAAGAGLAAAHARGLVHRDFKPANVLLGRDGEVVVTDFGLARGFESDAVAETLPAAAAAAPPTPAVATPVGLDDTMAATPAPSLSRVSRSQPVDLSSTLTRTGALLGTPAYMAPEQFSSGNVGPAADQFAFAVALYEGLTGARPFRGTTLDELRAAITTTTPDVGALPRAVRPVVARALARDPAARWPDMRALLAALDRRLQRPLRLALGIFAAALLVAGVVVAMRRGDGAPRAPGAAACVLTDDELAEVWSPSIAASLGQRFAGQKAWPQVAASLDQFAATWQRERAATCAAPTAPGYHGRVACLAGLRAELTAAVGLLGSGPPAMLSRAASADMLPSPEVCRSGRRAAMPALPDDPALRTELSALLAEGAQARMMASGGAGSEARTQVDAVVERARKLAAAYPPALVMALEVKASIVHTTGDCRAATPLYEETATAAEAAGVDGVRAMARIGVLECAIATSSDLPQIERLAEQARAAIQRAGDDAQLTAVLDLTLSAFDATRGDLDAAIARVERARGLFEQAGDWRRAGTAARNEAYYRLTRDGARDAGPTLALFERALEMTERAYPPGHAEVAKARLSYGMMLVDRDPAAGKREIAAAIAAMPRTPLPADAPTITGRVLDATGAPIAGATISAAPELTAGFDGEAMPVTEAKYVETTSGADGRFTLTVAPGASVMAVAPGLRSVPQLAGRAPLEFRLSPGTAIDFALDVTVPTPPPDADPTVASTARIAPMALVLSYQRGGIGWGAFGRSDAGGRFRFTDLPPMPVRAVMIALSPLGDQFALSFPIDLRTPRTAPVSLRVDLRGAALDVIVRADRGTIPTAQVMVLERALRERPTTVRELIPLMYTSGRWHLANATPVAPATRTSAGAALYRPADIHARLAAVTPGPVTVCVVPFAGDIADPSYTATLSKSSELEVRCEPRTITSAPLQALEIAAPPMKNQP